MEEKAMCGCIQMCVKSSLFMQEQFEDLCHKNKIRVLVTSIQWFCLSVGGGKNPNCNQGLKINKLKSKKHAKQQKLNRRGCETN